MSHNQSLIDAPVGAVFDVLRDARRYSDWVVGASRIRTVERPVMGPLRWVHNPLQDRAFWVRNWLSLQQLRRIAEGRAGAPHEPTGEPE